MTGRNMSSAQSTVEITHNVLIADDSATSRTLLQDMLAKDGIRTTCVAHADQVVPAVVGSPDTLVLLSSSLSSLQGVDLFADLQSDPNTAAVPVILTLTHDAWRDAEKALRLGVADCILMPFREQEVRLRVRAALARAIAVPRKSIPTEEAEYRVDPASRDREAVEQLVSEMSRQLHSSLWSEFRMPLQEVVQLSQTLTHDSSNAVNGPALHALRSFVAATQGALKSCNDTERTSEKLKRLFPLDGPRIDDGNQAVRGPHLKMARHSTVRAASVSPQDERNAG